MTNYEFYKETINRFYKNSMAFAMTKRGVIVACKDDKCEHCIFSAKHNPNTGYLTCGDRKMLWAVKEYVERPRLTKQERKFCELLQGKNMWFAKNRGMMFPEIYIRKPEKLVTCWSGARCGSGDLPLYVSLKFNFIKWEDEEPWSVAALLELEVEDGD